MGGWGAKRDSDRRVRRYLFTSMYVASSYHQRGTFRTLGTGLVLLGNVKQTEAVGGRLRREDIAARHCWIRWKGLHKGVKISGRAGYRRCSWAMGIRVEAAAC